MPKSVQPIDFYIPWIGGTIYQPILAANEAYHMEGVGYSKHASFMDHYSEETYRQKYNYSVSPFAIVIHASFDADFHQWMATWLCV